MIGYTWSTSLNAGMIHFVGGPYDGQQGLFDHDQYDSIYMCSADEQVTHVYKRLDRFRYYYDEAHHWGRSRRKGKSDG